MQSNGGMKTGSGRTRNILMILMSSLALSGCASGFYFKSYPEVTSNSVAQCNTYETATNQPDLVIYQADRIVSIAVQCTTRPDLNRYYLPDFTYVYILDEDANYVLPDGSSPIIEYVYDARCKNTDGDYVTAKGIRLLCFDHTHL